MNSNTVKALLVVLLSLGVFANLMAQNSLKEVVDSYDPDSRNNNFVYISPNVPIERVQAIKDSLNTQINRLAEPVFVAISYTQDTDDAAVMERYMDKVPEAVGDHKYLLVVVANIPGSVELNAYYKTNTEFSSSEDYKSVEEWLLKGRFESEFYAAVTHLDALKDFQNADGTFSFMSPAGKIVTLPEDTEMVVFSTGDTWNTTDGKFVMSPIGSLIEFKRGAKVFKAKRGAGTGNFNGYKSGDEVYQDVYSQTLDAHKVIIGMPCIDQGEDGTGISFLTKQIELPFTAVGDTYLADGSMKPYDHLSMLGLIDLKGNIAFDDKHKIYAQLTELGLEAKDFLENYLDQGQCGTGTSFYLFAHAYLINQYPRVYIMFKDSPKTYEQALYEFQKRHDLINTGEISSILQSYENAKSSMEYWVDKSVVAYKEMDEILQRIENLKSENDPEIIAETINEYYSYQELFNVLGPDVREHILSKLLEGDVNGYWLGLGNNEENTFIEMLTSTPGEDERAILDLFRRDNNKLFFTAIDRLDLGSLDQFLNTVVYWYSDLFPYEEPFGFEENVIPVPSEMETRYFFVDKSSPGSYDFSLGGGIRSYNKIDFSTTRKFSNPSPGQLSYYKRYCELSPFEYVTLEFGDQFNFNVPDGSGKIEAGTKITVPVVWAYWFQRRYHQEMGMKAVRIVMDVVAIATAPYTGGTTLMISEIAIAGLDIGFTLTEDYLNHSPEGRAVVEMLDKFAATYGAALGGYFLLSGAATATRYTITNIPEAYQYLKRTGRLAKGFKESLENLAIRLKSTKPLMAEGLISETRTLDLLDWVAEIQSGFKLKVKNLTAAVIIKGNLEYGIAKFSINQALGKTVLSEIRWLDNAAASSYEVRADLQNVSYLDESGKLVENANLKIVEKLDGSGFYLVKYQKTLSDLVSRLKSDVLAKIRGKSDFKLTFTDDQLNELVSYAKTFNFTEPDIAAVLDLHVRKYWVTLEDMKKVVSDLSRNAANNNIQFKPGWDMMRAFRECQNRTLKGLALKPQEYLSSSYISNHLSLFENGVSFFCPQNIIDQFGTLLGRADGVYVIPTSKMNEIMVQTNGDIALIEKELSIPTGEWQKQKMCRVDVKNPDELNLRMPTGSEEGANEYFTPGGLTSDGQLEAVIDPIPAKKYTYEPIN